MPDFVQHPAGFREIDPVSAQTLAGFRRIDVREPHEFTGPLGHAPGAELVPMGTIPEVSKAWRHDEPLLLICRSGGRSGQVTQWLSSHGFTDVLNLAGGMIAWNQAKLPVEEASS